MIISIILLGLAAITFNLMIYQAYHLIQAWRFTKSRQNKIPKWQKNCVKVAKYKRSITLPDLMDVSNN
jgi:hypothetical protein